MDLSVIILSWNTRDLLFECLKSLSENSYTIDVEFIVVDNASEDDSRDMVRTEYRQVKLVVNDSNIGFGAGNNTGIRASSGRYILFLNSDTVVMQGALDGMVNFADAQVDIGIVGPKLLNADGSLQYSCRRYPNLGTGMFRNTPLGRLFPKNKFTSDYLYSDWDHNTPKEVDWVSGAALMIRRDLVDKIGAFDEDYFMYCEDVDLCWRANHTEISEGKPWRVIYLPDSKIFHYIGRSSDRVPTRMTYEFHRSQHLFYKKRYASTTPILLRPIIPIGIWSRAAGQLIRHKLTYWRRVFMGELPKQ